MLAPKGQNAGSAGKLTVAVGFAHTVHSLAQQHRGDAAAFRACALDYIAGLPEQVVEDAPICMMVQVIRTCPAGEPLEIAGRVAELATYNPGENTLTGR